MRSSRRFSARSSGRSSGTRAPASSERCPSSTAPGSSSSRTPRPSQAGQAPWRLLNEKSRGSSGGKPVAHDGQKSCSEYSRSVPSRSEEHTSELQSPCNLVCRLLLEKKNPQYALYSSLLYRIVDTSDDDYGPSHSEASVHSIAESPQLHVNVRGDLRDGTVLQSSTRH